MNTDDINLAYKIRHALNDNLDALPASTTDRLAAARARAATLAGKRTLVAYPALPVLVKTPACPTIVAPPPPGALGEWRSERANDGVKSLFTDSAGRLLGFALNGTATAERAKLARELPPVLA